jgi:hypothetical protein
LKTIAAAQADFRANDRDWNHMNDFWRADVAGLYALEVEGAAIKLIALSVAAADDRPSLSLDRYGVMCPKAGFWYRGLPHADEVQRGPDRFAACCFPERLREGQLGTYLISEENVVRRKLLGHARGPEAHPTKEQLRTQEWETLD